MKRTILFAEVAGTIILLFAMKLAFSAVFATMNANIAGLLG